MNGQLRKEEDELRRIGVKTPTAQTDKLPYRQNNAGQEETNQQPKTSTQAYNFKMPQQTQLFASKPLMFKSRYINDNGRWTQNAVNDGFVDIKDYISDIKNDEQSISFNGKEMKISDDFQPEKKIEEKEENKQAKEIKLSDYEINENDFDIDMEEIEDTAWAPVVKTIAKFVAKTVIKQIILKIFRDNTVHAPGLED